MDLLLGAISMKRTVEAAKAVISGGKWRKNRRFSQVYFLFLSKVTTAQLLEAKLFLRCQG
ncbi:hypothetical protein [Hymenobacter arizonensis]|uniref:hypothetical protein n=1 Tax=Hymenobacter arizonensis TaxID=1227077 RepID=UPI001BE05FE9|nr:hypothetical protein [Hymenobacter arizonensis]